MKSVSLIAIFFAILISNANSLGQSTADRPLPTAENINPLEFNGFEKCSYSTKLSKHLDRFNTSVRPTTEAEGSSIFTVKSEFLGLPVTAIEMGICEDGSRDCGWSSFLGLIVPMPVDEVKARLKQKTSIDFTKERRATERNGAYTLHPILTKNGERKNESILFCDPGNL